MEEIDGTYSIGEITPGCNGSGGVITVGDINTNGSTTLEIRLYDNLGKLLSFVGFNRNVLAGSHSFENLANGTYRVTWQATVLGERYTPRSQFKTVSCSATHSFSVERRHVTVYGGFDGSITIIASGGTLPYSYSLDGGPKQSGNVFGYLKAGTYMVTVFEGSGGSTSKSVTISQPWESDGTFVKTQCYGTDLYEMVADGQGGVRQGRLLEKNSSRCGYVPPCDLMPRPPLVNGYDVQLAAQTSFPPVYFSLNGGQFSQVATHTGLAPGKYVVTYRDSNAVGCVSQNSFEIVSRVSGIHYSRNPFWYTVEAEKGTFVECDLWAETQHYLGDFRHVVTQSKVAGDGGAAHFRLDNILHRLLQPEPPVAGGAICKKTILNYSVRYRLDGQAWKTVPESTVILGGMPLERPAPPPFLRFLTSLPKLRRINPKQPEYLYFLVVPGRTGVRIRRGTYAAGATDPSYTYDELDGLKAHQLLCIEAFGNLAADVTKVDVTVLGSDNAVLSETVVYQLDPHPLETERFFLFHNSFGGFDTLRCVGPRETATDAREELGELEIQYGHSLQQGQRFVFNQTASRKIRQSTGANPEWRQEYLEDFILSAARFEQAGQLLPIILGKKSLENSNRTADVRQGYTFEYDYAFDLVGYAK